MRSKAIAVLLVAAAVASARAGSDEALEKGRAAAHALTETLRGRLAAAMKDGGALHAVGLCAYQAQSLANEVERSQGIRVRRTSLKLRNPKNAPDAYEKELLSRLAALAREGKLPEEVVEERREGGKTVYRYARPIVVGPPCLACHGVESEIPAEVRKAIWDRYPDDAAMGYRAGDFRGIVSVVIPAD